jgi:hypothetical protein
MKKKKFDLSTIAPLLLLALFAVSIATVLLMGAKLYRAQVENDRASYGERTAAQYISMRFKQSDKYGTIYVGDFDTQSPSESGNTFFVLEEHKGILYSTRIYAYDGHLYELFGIHDASYDRADGEPLFALADLKFSLKDGVLVADIVYADDSECSLVFSQRSGTEW